MGQTKSKETNALSKKTHFSKKEIDDLRQNVQKKDQNNITEQVFKQSVKQYVPTVTMTDDIFLKRLYHAFGGDDNQAIDFSKFVNGLSIFMKGTPEEKLKLSFRLYDIDKDGYISRHELEHVIAELSKMSTDQEETESNDNSSNNQQESAEILNSIDLMFADFDVDCDDKLSYEEYKLSFMKEPLVADFLERFLDLHGLNKDKRPIITRPRKPNSENVNRLSFRLSQAELLDYSFQQNQYRLHDASPRNSVHLPQLSDSSSITSPHSSNLSNHPKPPLSHRLSRGPSIASIDATLIQMSS